ncbi:putative lipoprotein LpqN [Mycolicibacterium chubuense NBB4]|uniref:Putative lipoprotein LpqN n=1 Tax=Mycolicibacterium chubuense (strain NBB4) TaxID=710421 RepID=I4BNS2_MYCCN|nr:LpqN/LpqT family lipoprotein [Mycolicibacterium chubuense]AFM18929.1 putative lipoprotein LpqN [Mycolicibacterium chubuense NBB4]
MTILMRAGVIPIAVVALGLGVSACGSDGKPADAGTATTSAASIASAAPTGQGPAASSQAPAPAKTLQDYIKENNIVETPVKKGDPGSPTIDLPAPNGWEDMGSATPDGAYSAISFTADPAMAQNPPTIITKVVKLTGNVDPKKVLEAAPGEVRNLPGFQGPQTGQANTLSGFDATVIGGIYPKDGATRMVAQKTVVIPGQDGLYVLQMNADGTEDQASPLMDATATIDKQAKITP